MNKQRYFWTHELPIPPDGAHLIFWHASHRPGGTTAERLADDHVLQAGDVVTVVDAGPVDGEIAVICEIEIVRLPV